MFEKSEILDSELESFFSDIDPFVKIFQIEGDIYRKTANRETKKFSLGERTFFLKYHGPIGYKEVLKNLLKFQLPTVSAYPEWKALQKLSKLGIKAPTPLAIISRGFNPANSESIIITESVEPNISIEEILESKLINDVKANEKRNIIKKVAQISRSLHLNGINHRDLYLCHFLTDKNLDPDKEIFLIDLHRAQFRPKVPMRWAIKDIGGLIHSGMGYSLTERDLYRFFEVYFDKSLKEFSIKENKFLESCIDRAFRMYMKPLLNQIDITSNVVQENFYKQSGSNFRFIFRKEYKDLAKNLFPRIDEVMRSGEIIKDEEGHYIVSCQFENESIFIKKYQVKSFFHFLRKLFTKTRARVSWESSHWLNSAGIRTFEIIGIIERFNVLSTTDSYLISKKIKGNRLDELVLTQDTAIKLAQSFSSFFKRLNWIKFNHGDTKKENFYFHNDQLISFDLDVSKRRPINHKNYLQKDKRRIIRSYKEDLEIEKLLIKRMESE